MNSINNEDFNVVKIKVNSLELQCTSSLALSFDKSLLYIGGGMNFKWKKSYDKSHQHQFFNQIKSLVFVLNLSTNQIISKSGQSQSVLFFVIITF
jgi:hypothetical protein